VSQGVKVAIGLLLSNGFPVPVPFFLSYFALYNRLVAGAGNANLPPHLQIVGAPLIHSQGFPVDCARNDVCRKVLESDADYLLFLDADMRHPADLVERLLKHDTAIVTARYHMRKPPFLAVAMRHCGPNAFDCRAIERGQGLMPIDFGGAGALLIRRDVLEAMGSDWFRYSRQTRAPFEYTISEDMHFYLNARKAGFQPYVDWDTECGHFAMMEVDGSWNRPFVEAADAQRARESAQQGEGAMPREVAR
jgi:glycosyltransferase involved in cell wall biosynthesis